MVPLDKIYEFIQILKEREFHYFDWNVDSGDIYAERPNEIVANIESQIKNKDVVVILLHDTKFYTLEALPSIIRLLQDNDFKLEVLTKDSPKIQHRYLL